MTKKKKRRTPTAADPPWTSDLKPAPGDLRIVQAFLNTVSFGKRAAEELASPEELRAWLTRWRLVSRETELGPADRELVVGVREALRAVVAAGTGAPVAPEMVARLDRAAATAPLRVRFEAGGSTRFEPLGDGLDGALARLFGLVAGAQSEDRWQRFKLCGLADCRSAFYDFSDSRTAIWCSVRCGNRAAARARRRRQRL